MMTGRLVARRDLEFLLYGWLEVPSPCSRLRCCEHSREPFDAALDPAERIAAERFAPNNRAADPSEPRASSGPQAGSSRADIATRAEPDGESPLGPRDRSFGNTMCMPANASIYLEAFGRIVLGSVRLDQWLAAQRAYREAEADVFRGKLQACRDFFLDELPRVDPQLELLADVDTTTLEVQGSWF